MANGGSYEIPSEEIQYDPSDVIGTGTYGTVYKGKCRGVEVAVKVPHKQSLNEHKLEKFRRRIKKLSSISSPYFVRVIGACTKPTSFRIVTELCKCNITTYLTTQDHMNWISASQFAWDIAEGLAYLPWNDIHLKPANILVDFHDQIKISDFGLDVLRDDAVEWGPHIWMTPRNAKSDLNPYRATLYSFGIIFWHLLTQEVPYQHLGDIQAFTDAVYHNHERPPFEAKHKIPKTVQSFVSKCWDPESYIFHVSLSVMISGFDTEVVWETKFAPSTTEPLEEVKWTSFQLQLASEVNIPAQQLSILCPLLAHRELIEEKEVYVVSKNRFFTLVRWFGSFYKSDGNGILEQMILLQNQNWFHVTIDSDEVKSIRKQNSADFMCCLSWHKTEFLINICGEDEPLAYWRETAFTVSGFKQSILNRVTSYALFAPFWLRRFCQELELRHRVSWIEFRDGLALELGIPTMQLDGFDTLFAERTGVDALCVTLDRLKLLVDRYGLFFDRSKELLEQVTLLHKQLWFYEFMTDEETNTRVSNYSKQTFLVSFGTHKPFFISSPNNSEWIERRRSGVLLGVDGEVYRSMIECVESFPPSRLTYICRKTGRLGQLPVKYAWTKHVKKFASWKNHEQLADVNELGLHIRNMQEKLTAEAELVVALAEITNLASLVEDCKLPQKAYKYVMSAWLRASLHQVVNESCAVFNFETSFSNHLVKIVSQASKTVNEILSNNTSKLVEGLCSEVSEELRQAIEVATSVKRKFDGIVNLIRELLDATRTGIPNKLEHARVSTAITTSLKAATKVQQQWHIANEWLEILKKDNEILLEQHKSLVIDSTQKLTFLMNKSNALILFIALYRHLSYDHLYLCLPLLDDLLAATSKTSDASTHTKLETEVKEKCNYYQHEIGTLIKNIEQASRETL